MNRSTLVRSFILMCLMGYAAPSLGQSRTEAAPLLEKVAATVAKSDVDGLKALSEGGTATDFRWLSETSNLSMKTRPFKVEFLELPKVEGFSVPPFSYITVSQYHSAQSTHDHLFPIVSTASGFKLGAEIPETNIFGWRVRDHKLNVRFSPPSRVVSINDEVTIERQADATPVAILRLNSIYRVRSVKSGGADVKFVQSGGFVAIVPGSEQRTTYQMSYAGKVEGAPEDFIKPNEAALTSYWYPHTGRKPATLEVKITVPKIWTPIGQGELVSKTSTNSTTTMHYRNKLPVCYFTIAAGKYFVTTKKMGNLQVSAYLLRKNPARAAEAIKTAYSALNFLGTNVAPYPFSSYAVVESDTFPAALECYSWTLCNASYIPTAVVHEVSHTWWGGIVPNTYTRTLWNESFAEYTDGLHARMKGGPTAHEYSPSLMAGGLGMMTTRSTIMESNNATDPAQAMIGYGKGSVVLEQLERMVGAQKMLAMMRKLVAKHQKGEDSEWQNVIDAAKEAIGPEWEQFFPSWLTRTDLPEFRFQDVNSEQVGSKWVVTGKLVQGEPAFWTAVPIVVKAGAKSARQVAMVKSTSTDFRIEMVSKPGSVLLDPNKETYRKMSPTPIPPTLVSYTTSSGTLTVVYGTGGSEEENAAAKTVAEKQVTGIFPFAKIVVVADNETSPKELDESSLLFVGKAEHLKIDEKWKSCLAVKLSDGQIEVGRKVIKGAGLWGFTVATHPTKRGAFAGHVAAMSPKALLSFKNQSDLEGSKSQFISQGGKMLYGGHPKLDDPTIFILP